MSTTVEHLAQMHREMDDATTGIYRDQRNATARRLFNTTATPLALPTYNFSQTRIRLGHRYNSNVKSQTFPSFTMAALSGLSPSQYSSHAVSLRTRDGTLRTVNLAGSRPFFTWFQVIGIETGAPGRPRGDNGATAVAIRSLRR